MTEPNPRDTEHDEPEGAEEAPAVDEIAAEAVATEENGEPAAEEAPEPTVEEQLTAERDALQEKWLRAVAELDNVRKRSRRDVVEARRFAQADALRPLLDVADGFERALESMAGDAEATVESVREGVALIHQRFQAALREQGVEVLEAQGAEFDPACHEAVAQVPSEDADAGVVIEVVQQGYRCGDFLLRPARVIISS